MEIIKVKYAALANTGNFTNEKIELEAKLQTGDNLTECLEQLRTKVHSELHNIDEYYQMRSRFEQARSELVDIESKLRRVSENWDCVSEFMQKQGIEVDSFLLNCEAEEEIEFDFDDNF